MSDTREHKLLLKRAKDLNNDLAVLADLAA